LTGLGAFQESKLLFYEPTKSPNSPKTPKDPLAQVLKAKAMEASLAFTPKKEAQ